jgi:hypothetical protein
MLSRSAREEAMLGTEQVERYRADGVTCLRDVASPGR